MSSSPRSLDLADGNPNDEHAQQPARPGRRPVSPLTVIGIVLLVAGLSCLGWVGYQYFGTNVVSQRAFDNERTELVVGELDTALLGPILSAVAVGTGETDDVIQGQTLSVAAVLEVRPRHGLAGVDVGPGAGDHIRLASSLSLNPVGLCAGDGSQENLVSGVAPVAIKVGPCPAECRTTIGPFFGAALDDREPFQRFGSRCCGGAVADDNADDRQADSGHHDPYPPHRSRTTSAA